MTKTELQELISLYVDAEKKILNGQQVSMGGKTLDRADLDAVRRGREKLEHRLSLIGKKRHSLARFS